MLCTAVAMHTMSELMQLPFHWRSWWCTHKSMAHLHAGQVGGGDGVVQADQAVGGDGHPAARLQHHILQLLRLQQQLRQLQMRTVSH
jgi:hypothetical protein